ncbi:MULTISPECIES: ankyrin repeat domain-containing protein [unclassified Paenibacillus]|uniref:ankyrin repeat domain-containing protein n=1 Tax=unclassified Paenibacillus TaxID=185978 RepID=UPI00083908C0|nr:MULTISPECIES: ankyrin repeat domain-containing protein [unclassified Paenibacillus]NWL88277.1 hypothetical protein [Paenibacillus sp. 79R4]
MKKFFYFLGYCILLFVLVARGLHYTGKIISHNKLKPITNQIVADLSYLAENDSFNPTKEWINQYIDQLYNSNIINNREDIEIRISEIEDMYFIDAYYRKYTDLLTLHAHSSNKGFLASPVSGNITVSNEKEETFYEDDSEQIVNAPLEPIENHGDIPVDHQISLDASASNAADDEDEPGSDYFTLRDSLPLLEAVYNSDTEQVLTLLKKTNINLQDERGFTPLMIAVRVWDTEMVKLLLNKGADPDLKDEEGWTALMLAAGENNSSSVDGPVDGDSDLYEMMEYLLDSGADPNVTNLDGYTALMWAAQSNDVRIVKLLLDHSAIPGIVAYDGNTAMKNAQMVENRSIQSLLIQAEINE